MDRSAPVVSADDDKFDAHLCCLNNFSFELQCHTRLFSLPKSMRRLLEEEDNVLSIERPPIMHVGKGIL
jgi:hypothetical protein